MKKNLKILVLNIITYVLLINVCYASDKGNVTTDLKMREEASTSSKVLTTLTKGTEVEVIEKTGDWYKVKYKDYEGYMYATYVKVEETEEPEETKPEEEETPEQKEENNEPAETEYPQEIKTKSDLSVHILPLITSNSTNTIKEGTTVTITRKLNDWSYIEYKNVSGWVRNYKLATVEEVKESESEKEPEKEEKKEEKTEEKEPVEENKNEVAEKEVDFSTGYINVSAANVRKEASKTSDRITTLTINTEVTVNSEVDGWYKIKFKDYEGYILKTLISTSPVENQETTSRSQGVSRDESSEKAEEETISDSKSGEKEEESKESKSEEKEKNDTKESNISEGQKIVNFAKKYLGYRYVYGGTTPSKGFDCTGFTYYVYNSCGYSLSRTGTVQAKTGKSVAKSDLQAGDLLLFNNNSDGSIGHVGIYISNGTFIHAANPNRGVVTDTINSGYYKTYYYGARRIY